MVDLLKIDQTKATKRKISFAFYPPGLSDFLIKTDKQIISSLL